MALLIPADHQVPLPLDRLLLTEAPDDEAMPMDVIVVGGGPAGLACAIKLAQLARADPALGELEIAVLEKASGLGEHNLSGAVVNPIGFRELFPDVADADFPFRQPVPGEKVYFLTRGRALRIPVPPTMKNHGNFVASISEICRWLGEKAEALGVNVFPGFPVDSLLLGEAGEVRGVRTTPAGLLRDGTPGPNAEPAGDLTAKVTVLAEGTRGPLTQAYIARFELQGPNPQIFALGVKEIWETQQPLGHVIHTMGWPLPGHAFGGSFVYPLGERLVSLGLVVGLDYRETGFDIFERLQVLKRHRLLAPLFEGGTMVEYGAKTIPEGGYYSLPTRLSGAGVLMCGDAVGLVNVPAIKGIHYAMLSGIAAAETIAGALKAGDCSAPTLAAYDARIHGGVIEHDLYRTRNMRLAFTKGFFRGSVAAGLMTLTKGAFPGRRIAVEHDAAVPKRVSEPAALQADGSLTFSKVDAVYRAKNATRDTIPSHLVVTPDVSPELAVLYEHLCPAQVYERQGEELVVNAPNCIDCKATDVLGPRWLPREGGSGPQYRQM